MSRLLMLGALCAVLLSLKADEVNSEISSSSNEVLSRIVEQTPDLEAAARVELLGGLTNDVRQAAQKGTVQASVADQLEEIVRTADLAVQEGIRREKSAAFTNDFAKAEQRTKALAEDLVKAEKTVEGLEREDAQRRSLTEFSQAKTEFEAWEALLRGVKAAAVLKTAKDAQEEARKATDDDSGTKKVAKDYLDAYADNVQTDVNFRENEQKALRTIRETNPRYGTWWAILPPLIAILLALITKEVYSSLFIGIVAGGLLYSGFGFEGTLTHVMKDGFITSISDSYNIGILLFLVLLGALVAMMNKTGASAAFGRWAQTHIRSRVGAQIATVVLGMLIFVDDYFNCLTVGSVMRPVTDAKRVSRAKLAYLIDATAAPICIIAPISSWAAAVAGFAKGAGAESGFSLFINAIPYNFYAILTIVTMFFFSLTKFDFGPMKRHEQTVSSGHPDMGAIEDATEALVKNDRGRVIDLVVPVLVLIVCCMLGMIYSGGFFDSAKAGEGFHDFVKAFSNSDASVGLVLGSIVAIVFAVLFYVARRVISFRDCMDAFPEGFKAMVPAIMILCCAWTLKTMTDSLGAKIFISDLINGPAAGLQSFLPAIIFVIAIVLAFSTGTSWGTFGILIPIVLAAIPGSEMTIVAVSACMAGAVCGDHCSPISDTTIMASAGAQCNHVAHVNTQLPYALLVAVVSFVGYIIAPIVGSAWIALPMALGMMLVTLFFVKLCLKGAASGEAFPAIFRKFAQTVEGVALSAVLERMAKGMLADGKIDMDESGQLQKLLQGMEGQEEFRKAVEKARSDGVITMEESANLERYIRHIIQRRG